MRTVFLIGFMGVGKTTLGQLLAGRLQLRFADLDREIVLAQQHSFKETDGIAGLNVEYVSQLVDAIGMDAFRDIESATLKSRSWENHIVSCGGGTPCFFDNIEWMKAHGTVLWLQANEAFLFSRLKQGNLNKRPLLRGKSDDELRAYIHHALQEREPFYSQAHITFDVMRGEVDALIQQLQSL